MTINTKAIHGHVGTYSEDELPGKHWDRLTLREALMLTQREREALRAQLDTMHGDLTESLARENDLEKLLAAVQEENVQWQGEHTALKMQYGYLAASLAASEADHTDSEKALIDSVLNLREALGEALSQLSRLVDRLAASEAARAQMREALEEIEQLANGESNPKVRVLHGYAADALALDAAEADRKANER